ncbi:hypothetical protein HMPREF0577_2300, partial [Mobiluncus mulieris ATCC 35243]
MTTKRPTRSGHIFLPLTRQQPAQETIKLFSRVINLSDRRPSTLLTTPTLRTRRSLSITFQRSITR